MLQRSHRESFQGRWQRVVAIFLYSGGPAVRLESQGRRRSTAVVTGGEQLLPASEFNMAPQPLVR